MIVSNRNIILAVAALAGTVLVAAPRAHAATELSYNFNDTTPVTGSASVDTVGNGDSGSFNLATTAGGKASVYLFLPGGAPLGTLGDLTSLTFDYKVNTNTTPVAASAPAIRFFTSNTFTQALVWENAYQATQTTDTVWHDDVNILPQSLWQRANSHNFDQIANLNTKAGFQGGFTPTDGAFTGATLSPSTQIYGLQLTFGSGVAGTFNGNVDDVNVNFATGSFTSNVVPEPASFGLLALGGIALLGRRGRRTAVAK